jgi:hypothetical protein
VPARRHLEDCEEHQSQSIAQAKKKANVQQHSELLNQQLAYQPLSSAPAAQATGAFANFVLTPEQAALSAQAMWYVYARMHVSKSGFEDPMFVEMMRRQALSMMPAGTDPKSAPLLKVAHLKKYVHAEFGVFLIFLGFAMDMKFEQAKGNPFAQFLHDGGTLANHRKYQVRTHANSCLSTGAMSLSSVTTLYD